VLGVPLERTESEEGSAFGAALLAGVRSGAFASAEEAVERCVRVSETVEPDAGWSAVYEREYPRYRLLYPTLRGLGESAAPAERSA
jgi:xylulokinase